MSVTYLKYVPAQKHSKEDMINIGIQTRSRYSTPTYIEVKDIVSIMP